MKWVKQSVAYWCDDIISGKYTGKGVNLAVLDTGAAFHPDLNECVKVRIDFTGNTCTGDDSGHGTHVAGILAGSGKVSGGIYAGMAPGSGIYSGKVLDREGNGNVDSVLKGIDWVQGLYRRGLVRVVNFSVGTKPDLPQGQKQLLLEAVEDLWDMGAVVVVSSGNYGPASGSVAVPGNSRKVITVGVPDRVGMVPYLRGNRRQTVNYSGRGPTEACVVKPDVFAPGTGIISCNSRYGEYGEHPYVMKTGTSMAAPVVAGAVACLLSKYPDMTNVEVKLKLRQSCVRMEGTEAGWGMLHVGRLLQA